MDECIRYLYRFLPTKDHVIRDVLKIIDEDEEFYICENKRKKDAVFKKSELYLPKKNKYGYEIFGFDEYIAKFIVHKIEQNPEYIQNIKAVKQEIDFLFGLR